MKVYYECDNDGALLDFFSITRDDLEEWLYNTAKLNNINPVDFGLPNKPGDLHKEEFRKVKTKLNEFLSILSNFPELQFLKSHLT